MAVNLLGLSIDIGYGKEHNLLTWTDYMTSTNGRKPKKSRERERQKR